MMTVEGENDGGDVTESIITDDVHSFTVARICFRGK